MGSDGKEEFGFSMNYKASGSPPSSNWQSAVANASMNNVQESSLRVPTSSESLSGSFFSLNWEPLIEQSIPFQSSLSPMVSPSPPASSLPSDNIAIRELIGRLGGNLCSVSGPLGSTMDTVLNMGTAWNPSNSSPNLNLAMDPSKGSLAIQGAKRTPPHSLAQFSSDPGFAERAARFSCFGNRNYPELATPFNFPEGEPSYRSAPADSSKIPRVQSNQSLKAGLPINLPNMAETKESNASETPYEGSDTDPRFTDRKISSLSRSSTPVSTDDMKQRRATSGNESEEAELSTGREESSSFGQIAGREPGSKTLNEINGRKRRVLSKSKAKDAPSVVASPGGRETKSLEADESPTKRYKGAEAASNEKDDAKSKAEQNTIMSTGESSPNQTKDIVKALEPPKDYIHVRARRGQATDSHSLAERVRREKISERMKFLQDLVPGCSKVTGKAVMLDEIINYVQSLQRQVEFLSMKLATVNPRLDFNMDGLIAKDMLQSHSSSPRMLFATDPTAAFPQLHQPQQGPVQVGVTCGTEGHRMGHPVEGALRRTMNSQPPCMDGYGDSIPQGANGWDEDLHSVVQMGFGQNRQSPFTSQGFHGSVPTSHMKIEL